MAELKDIAEAIDKQGRAFDEFKKTNDERLERLEKGLSASDHDAKLDSMSKAMDEAKAKMEQLYQQSQKPIFKDKEGKEIDPKDVEYKKDVMQYIRKGREDGLRQKEAEYIERKALQIAVNADGGFALPEEIDREISALAVNISPMRSICNIVTVGTTDYKKLMNVRGTTSGWVGETAPRNETNTPQLAEIPAFMGEIYAEPRATQTMLDDVFFDAEGWLAGEIATEFSRAENLAFMSGDGTNKPKGILAYTFAATADGVRAFGQYQYLPTGVAGDWAASNKADILIDLTQSVKAFHRTGSRWVTNKALLGEMRKFKDGQGQYLWQPSLVAGMPDVLLGYPVTEAEDAPAKAASSLSVLFGNFTQGYTIVDRIGVRVLRDPYTTKPYIKFYTTKRVGGMGTNTEAIKAIRFAVS